MQQDWIDDDASRMLGMVIVMATVGIICAALGAGVAYMVLAVFQ